MNRRLFVLGLVLMMGLGFCANIPLATCDVDLNSAGDYYYLTNDVTINTHENGTCFNITADNVVLDLKGFRVYSPSIADFNLSNGVNVTGHNVTIMNGTFEGINPLFNPAILSGMAITGNSSNLTVRDVDFIDNRGAFYLFDSYNHTIEDCDFEGGLAFGAFFNVSDSTFTDIEISNIVPQPNFLAAAFFLNNHADNNTFQNIEILGILRNDLVFPFCGLYVYESSDNSFDKVLIHDADIGVYMEGGGVPDPTLRNSFEDVTFSGQMTRELHMKGIFSAETKNYFIKSNFHDGEVSMAICGGINISPVAAMPAAQAGFPSTLLGALNMTNTTQADVDLAFHYNNVVISPPSTKIFKNNGTWSELVVDNSDPGMVFTEEIENFSIFAAYGDPYDQGGNPDDDGELSISTESYCGDGGTTVLDVLVMDENGDPVSNVEVSIVYYRDNTLDCKRGSGSIDITTLTGETDNGKVTFTELAPGVNLDIGRYDIEATKKNYKKAERTVCWDLECGGKDYNLEFIRSCPNNLTIRITDVAGGPLPDFPVKLSYFEEFPVPGITPEEIGEKNTDANGFASFGGLEPGYYGVTVESKTPYVEGRLYGYDYEEPLVFADPGNPDEEEYEELVPLLKYYTPCELNVDVTVTCPDENNVSCVVITITDENGEPVEGAQLVFAANPGPGSIISSTTQTITYAGTTYSIKGKYLVGGNNFQVKGGVGGPGITYAGAGPGVTGVAGGGIAGGGVAGAGVAGAGATTLGPATNADGQIILCSDQFEDGQKYATGVIFIDPNLGPYQPNAVEFTIDFDDCEEEVEFDKNDTTPIELPEGEGEGEGEGTGETPTCGVDTECLVCEVCSEGTCKECSLVLEVPETMVGEEVTAWVRADGEPCAGKTVSVQDFGTYETDEEGKVLLSFDNAGTYHIKLLEEGTVCDEEDLSVVLEIEEKPPEEAPPALIEDENLQKTLLLGLVIIAFLAGYQYYRTRKPRKKK